MQVFEGTYTDARGSVPVTVESDGQLLRTRIRDADFEGQDFESLAIAPATLPAIRNRFALHEWPIYGGAVEHCLCEYQVALAVKLPMVSEGRQIEGILELELEVGTPALAGQKSASATGKWGLQLQFRLGDSTIRSMNQDRWFEDQLLDIERQLPSETHIQCCFFCAYSDYSPYGSGLNGMMLCFRNVKDQYVRTTTKHEVLALEFEGQVQETHLCDTFSRRVKGTGYRG